MATFAAGLRTPFARSRLSGFLAAAVIATALLTGCGAPSSPAATQVSTTKTTSQSPGSTPVASVPSVPASRAPSGPPTAEPVAPGAGGLPQTRVFPSADSAAFHHAMQDMWLAVSTGNARLALPAFFPRAAYQQLKAIYDPGADWDDRLWYDLTLDVAAAHKLVGADARLVRVLVASDDAAWVYSGVCDNSIGYWHVSGARLVYREHGQERSFGIASLISWRGVWYVVHFGAVLRSAVTGIVDDPEPGPGIPGPAGGC